MTDVAKGSTGVSGTQHLERTSLLTRWRDHLLVQVDAASLAVFRICFGLIMLWEVWRYLSNGWIDRYYIEPTFFFSYIPFIQPWGGNGMYWHFYFMGVLAAMIAVGVFYRVAAWLFFFAFTYVFLLDKTQYLNHFYLISLVSLLMALVPAQHAWSVDQRWSSPRLPQTTPRWSLWLLCAQIGLVYVYGGIAKLNPDWLLRGEPMHTWMAERADLPLIGQLLTQHWVAIALSYGGLLVDLLLPFLLIWRRMFWLGVMIAVAFNVINAYIFSIGIFPFFMIAALVLFARPDWPRLVLQRLGVSARSLSLPTRVPQSVGYRSVILLVLVHLYMLVQFTVPLRHWLYPGDVNWTEQGHRFAWRMKLRDKDVDMTIYATHPQTGERWEVEPRDWLTRRQASKMVSRPDMVHQFAHYVAGQYEMTDGVRAHITVEARSSLNGRPEHNFIDPSVDLAAEPINRIGPASWIMPLQE